jgi:Na+/H+ antiporter NhaD/arsenite permease-like protein
MEIIIFVIGLSSAIIDNVPLVAAVQGMYTLTEFPTNHFVWIYLSYCAGTGGSILIIGSAAGVAVQEKAGIEFGWFARKVGWLALIGYTVGAIAYLLLTWYVYPYTLDLFLK